MNYYIADMHLGHANIMRHSNRPFNSVAEMDETIIKNCKRITPEDHIYFLGDMCMKLTDQVIDQIKSIKGHKHLIIGNHDRKFLKDKRFRDLFESIDDMKTVYDGNYTIVLCHYPIIEWDGFFRGTLHFYGHVHNNDNTSNRIMRNIENAYNVGVDILNFEPKTVKEIIALSKNK